MIQLLIRRLLGVIPTMIMVTFGVFMLLSLVPGDPAFTMAGAGGQPTMERIEQVREAYNLDDPLLVQYGRWIFGAIRLDFGDSIVSGASVVDEIKLRLPVTLSLAFAGVFVALLIGLPLGLLAGMRPGGNIDRFSRIVSTLGVSIPSFWLGIMLVIFVSLELGWLPATGFTRFNDSPTQWARYVILPAVTLGLGLSAIFSRQLRASLIDVMNSKFIMSAWARGGRPRTVIGKHALKNASIAPVTVLGLQIGYLVGGTVIVEQIFAIPGIGSYMLRSIITLDLPVIQAVTIVFVTTTMIMSLLVDLLYGFLNPKVRVN